MFIVKVQDVGDGLSVSIRVREGDEIQLDCGSQQGGANAYIRGISKSNPDSFVLSHYHGDHYNGLLEAAKKGRSFNIREVIIPRVPDFAEKESLVLAFFAMNLRVFGGSSGSMDYDFLTLIRKITAHRFSYRLVK